MTKTLRYTMLIMIGILLSGTVTAQRNVKIGNKYFKKFDFLEAIPFYLKAVDKNPENVKAVEKLALSYKHINDFDQSAYWLGELVALNGDSANYKFYYAQSLRANQKYDEAKKYYDDYMAAENAGFVSDILGSGFDYIENLEIPNPNIELENATNLNSESSDFGIAFKDLGEVVFCSTRPSVNGFEDNWTHEGYTDLFSSSVTFKGQELPKKFADDKYNGIYHDGPAMFSGDKMYLTRSNYVNRKVKKAKEDKTVKLQLHEVDINSSKNGVKKYSEKLVFNNKEYSVGHATISNDGKYMLFSSDGSEFEGHKGGTDLYLSVKKGEDGAWGDPKNLGSLINTPADEEYPFFGANNKVYFSSDGHYGLGGLDIYTTTMSEDLTFGKPVNMGAPLNTSFDDFNYVFNAQEGFGFLSSNRPGGQGSDDIYTFRYKNGDDSPAGSTMLRTMSYDSETLEPIAGVKITIDKCVEGELESDANGKVKSRVNSYMKCRVMAEKEGYYPKQVPFSVFERDVDVEIPLTKRDSANNIQLQVCVYERRTGQPIVDAEVKVFNNLEGKFENVLTDEYGCAIFDGIRPDQCYGIVGTKEVTVPDQKYLTTTEEACTHGVEAPALVQKQLYLDYVTLGEPIIGSNSQGPDGLVLPIIYYNLNKFNIRKDAAAELDELVKIMNDNPTIEIEAASHTDCRRDVAYNMNLSEKRAKEAVLYLEGKGINSKRLTWGAYGETQLVNDCDCECDGDIKQMGLKSFRDCEDKQVADCSEQDHQLNRRTEFVVTKF